MSKKFLWLSVAVLAIAIIIFVINFLGKSDDKNIVVPAEDTVALEAEKQAQASLSGSGSMDYLMTRGENLECKIVYEATGVDEQTTEGTYFTSRERLRGDFLITDAGPNAVSSVIINDGIMYSWTEIDGEKYGMKVSLETLNKTKSSEESLQVKEVVPLDANVKYDCKVWENVDGSVFEAPTDIVFKDFTQIMNTGMEFGTSYEELGGAADRCGACNQLSGNEKKQCLTAFSC